MRESLAFCLDLHRTLNYRDKISLYILFTSSWYLKAHALSLAHITHTTRWPKCMGSAFISCWKLGILAGIGMPTRAIAGLLTKWTPANTHTSVFFSSGIQLFERLCSASESLASFGQSKVTISHELWNFVNDLLSACEGSINWSCLIKKSRNLQKCLYSDS